MSSPNNNGKKRKEIDNDAATKTYAQLEAENGALQGEIESLKGNNKSLSSEKVSLKEEIESLKAKLLEATKGPSDDEVSDDDDDDGEYSIDNLNDPWMAKFNELREYRIIRGDSKVSYGKGSCHVKLGRWVDGQRTSRKKGKLSQERINLLDSVGMFWGVAYPAVPSWENQFDELKKYHTAMGNCNIKVNPTNPSPLAKWVAHQRMEYKRFKKGQPSLLTLEQIGKLKDLDFKWKAATKK